MEEVARMVKTITLALVYLDIRREIAKLVILYYRHLRKIILRLRIEYLCSDPFRITMLRPVSKWQELPAQLISITSNATE